MKKINDLRRKWHLLIKIMPLLLFAFVLKLISHQYGLEIISMNALFTSLIAATTFLIGFLITGVISDYKESEKLPGELASSMETIYDEAYIINKNKGSILTKEFLAFQGELIQSVYDWFYRKQRISNVMDRLSRMNDYFAQLESLTQATYINRMKQEQNNIRRMITRVHTIRETNFVQSAYAIVEALAVVLVISLLILKLEPFYESVFFSLTVSFMVLYMLFLIKDLDNPFDYQVYGEMGDEVSLKPIQDLLSRVKPKT